MGNIQTACIGAEITGGISSQSSLVWYVVAHYLIYCLKSRIFHESWIAQSFEEVY